MVYDLKQCLFQFHWELQRISTTVSGLNRHHRPRGSPEDEENVKQLSRKIEARLHCLRQGWPYILDRATEDPDGFSLSMPGDLEQLTMLARLCKISYYAEIIYHARGSGVYEFGSSTINSARKVIRDMISQHPGSGLSPAFMWPLFLYIVESTTSDEADWGLKALDHVSDPLWIFPLSKSS